MASVPLETALSAFDAAMREKAVFVLEGGFGGTIEFHPSRWGGRVSLDCWFFDSGLSEARLSVDAARRLAAFLYSDCTEYELLAWLKSEGAECVLPKPAV
jgi:hypothetical protein